MILKTIKTGLSWMLLLGLIAANLFIGVSIYSKETDNATIEEAYDHLSLFTKVLDQVHRYYVDADKVGYEQLVEGALEGMLQSLDPHSQFMNADVYKDMKDDTAGEFGGLGIVISVKDSVLTIVAPMEDTPGYEAGLMAGDKILEIEGESTKELTLTDAVKQLRGKPGTSVKIKIFRPATREFKDVEVVRAIIKVKSVKDAHYIEPGIGYVRLTQFNAPTADALQDALDELMAEPGGLQGLVLDLRNNPGGLLTSAVEVSQKFLDRGQLVVYTQGRTERQKQVFRAKGRTHLKNFPMVILVNGGSASAAEIVSGALQDHKRAVLVGVKTFGKGSVQSILPISQGTAIRLTTAKYYTPSERVINGHGIEPDIVVPMDPTEWAKLFVKRNRPKNAEPLENQDEIDSAVDRQLERAVDVIKGILVFEARADRTELMAAKP